MIKVVFVALNLALANGNLCPTQGIFPHPADCQKFLQCAPGYDEPFVRSCSPGTLFDPALKVCAHANTVNCESAEVPSTTTTTTSTTTSSTSSSPSTTTLSTSTTTEKTTSTSTERTTSTSTLSTTSSSSSTSPVLPDKVMAFYLAVAADIEPGYHTDDDWQPLLFDYQQQAANVLILTFIHPGSMVVPKSFQNLVKTRGTGNDGAVPADTIVLFSIGGYSYSLSINPWPFLETQAAAEAMAEQVAQWPSLYGCDGIDIDIEEGAGQDTNAGVNLGHFVRRIRELNSDMIINLPVYGYPFIPGTNELVNESWNPDGSSNGLTDTIGIMVYNDAEALNYVDNYSKGNNFAITANVPERSIMVGCRGTASASVINTLVAGIQSSNLRGMIVWFATVRNGFTYAPSWDTSLNLAAQEAFISAKSQLSP